MSDWGLDFYHRRLSEVPEFDVTKSMLWNAGIGKSYWPAAIGKIPDSCNYKKSLRQMVESLSTDERLGRGAIFFGKHGYGKTSATAIMLKSAMARGGQCFHRIASSVEHAYEKRWTETNFDGIEVWDLLTKSQLLTLDDLGQEQATGGYKVGDIRIIEELIRSRYDRRLVTYISINLPLQIFVKQYPSIGSIFLDPKRFYLVEVDGHNWRHGEEEA